MPVLVVSTVTVAVYRLSTFVIRFTFRKRTRITWYHNITISHRVVEEGPTFLPHSWNGDVLLE
jgi:hypothetical protein